MRDYIHDFYGRIIGSLEKMPNGDVKARDRHGRILGTYVKALDITKDEHGRILTKGDTTSSLVWQAEARLSLQKNANGQGK